MLEFCLFSAFTANCIDNLLLTRRDKSDKIQRERHLKGEQFYAQKH